jgi:hypothetical protein
MLPDTLEIQISLLISGTPTLTITLFTHGRDFTCLDTITVGQSGTTITKALHPRGLPPPTPRVPCFLCRWVSSQLHLPCLNAPYNHTSRESPDTLPTFAIPKCQNTSHGLLTHTAIEPKRYPLTALSSAHQDFAVKSIYIYSSIKSSLNPFIRGVGLKYEQPPSAIWALLFSFLIVGCCDPVAEEERMWAVLLSGSEMGNLNLYAIAGVAFIHCFYYTFFSNLGVIT